MISDQYEGITNSHKLMHSALRHCRKVYWYIDTLNCYVNVTKGSLREAMTEDQIKKNIFRISWDGEVLFIEEVRK